MPHKWDVRHGIPLQLHLQRWCIPASPGHAAWVSCQGGSLLCSASSSLIPSTHHFSHSNLPSGRGWVITGGPLQGHGHPASWPWASWPQTLGSINAWQGDQAGQLILGSREGVIFLRAGGCSWFFLRGLTLICSTPLGAARPTRRSSRGVNKHDPHWGYQGSLCASTTVQHLAPGSRQYPGKACSLPLFAIWSKMGCHRDRDFQSCWRHSDIYSFSALISTCHLNPMGLKIPA